MKKLLLLSAFLLTTMFGFAQTVQHYDYAEIYANAKPLSYKVNIIIIFNDSVKVNCPYTSIPQCLNAMNSQGWEYLNCMQGSDAVYKFILRKPNEK